jgi:6-phosphogluconate dehydrogenase
VSPQARIGVIGLAVMGSNLAHNLARNGHPVALYNRTGSRTKALVAEYGHEGEFVAAQTPAEFVAALQRPRRMVIMVKAGAPTDAVIDQFAPLLEAGDVIIDGGNAHFADTRRREQAVRERGLHFVGVGISGGEEGALHGPSIMPGGSVEAYESLAPMLTDIAAKVDGVPCVTHIGPDGAGHFVKMVHNGIEYADMQLIAEAYDLLRRSGGLSPAQIAEVFRGWDRGRLRSYLVEITAEVLQHTDPGTGAPFVDVVRDAAEQKGTGRWTVQCALDLGVPVSGIAEATFARSLSGDTAVRAAAADLPGPPPAGSASGGGAGSGGSGFGGSDLAADVEQALYASKIVAYAQGFQQIRAGSDEYGWGVDLGAVASIWRGGCIIRAEFLDRIRAAFDADPQLATLLVAPHFAEAVGAAQEGWRRVVATAVGAGVPVPGFAAALSYYDSIRARRLPANLIQGLRDYFGAHTYQRVDRDGSYHTRWGQDRAEQPAD